jgi:hypothetical protein
MLDIFKIEKQSSSNLGFINKVMWSYHVAQVNSYDINTEVPRDLKQETISELAQVAKEATIEVLHDTVDHVISESDVPLVDYDLHSEVMDATILLLVQEGLQSQHEQL